MSIQIVNFASFRPASGGPPPDFQAAGAINGGGTTPTPPTHAGDDILIAVSYDDSGSNLNMTTGTAGWTKIGQDDNPGWTSAAFFWKRATGSGTAGPNITNAGDTVCYAIRGCVASGTPYEGAAVTGLNSSTAPASSAITTLGPNRFAVAIFTFFTGANFTAGYPPSGWTNDSNQFFNGGGGGSDARFAFMSKDVVAAGSVSAETMTSSSTSWHSLTLAFLPT